MFIHSYDSIETVDDLTTETREHEVAPSLLDSDSIQQLPKEEETKTALEPEKGVLPQSASSLEIMQEQMSNEEYRCWKDLLANPDEFETWVKLLALSEKHVSSWHCMYYPCIYLSIVLIGEYNRD